METVTTQLIVLSPGIEIHDDEAIAVEIDDEGGGPFLVIRQNESRVLINRDEWPAVRNAVNRLAREIEKLEEK